MTYTIDFTDAGDPDVRGAILDGLVEFNDRQTGVKDFRPLALALKAPDGTVVGGLWGRTAYSWLFVELLFVPESLRKKGLGGDLMRRAEEEAVARGCHSAWLDTFQFQARGFYERLGYECFAELADYPPGVARYFMKKRLPRA